MPVPTILSMRCRSWKSSRLTMTPLVPSTTRFTRRVRLAVIDFAVQCEDPLRGGPITTRRIQFRGPPTAAIRSTAERSLGAWGCRHRASAPNHPHARPCSPEPAFKFRLCRAAVAARSSSLLVTALPVTRRTAFSYRPMILPTPDHSTAENRAARDPKRLSRHADWPEMPRSGPPRRGKALRPSPLRLTRHQRYPKPASRIHDDRPRGRQLDQRRPRSPTEQFAVRPEQRAPSIAHLFQILCSTCKVSGWTYTRIASPLWRAR